MQSFHYLFGDQGVFVAGAVVDDEIHLDLVLYGFVYDFGRVLYHLQIQHTGKHFVKREYFMSQKQVDFPTQ